MSRILRMSFGLLCLVIMAPGTYAGEHHCASDAKTRAEKMMAFHLPDAGHPFGFADKVETITPLENPAARDQIFDVLQIWAYVYKAKYRLRFLYAQLPSNGNGRSCVLMGQEILEYAKL